MIDVSKEESVLPEQVLFILIFFVAIFIIMLFSGKKSIVGGSLHIAFVCVKKTAYGNKKKREIFSDGQEKNCLEFLRMFIFDIGTLMVWHNFAKFSGKL